MPAEPAYYQVLSRHQVAHLYNLWSCMPSLAEQHRPPGSLYGSVHGFETPAAPHDELGRQGGERGHMKKNVGELPEMRAKRLI